ncbi:ubiquinone biosynthesis accessory factor UbiJ [Halorhodospira neutriphila]|uniref:Ubiquinone biosynthesis accessory factor UbiJ n=1 Tax=Halorhodospira neutriphila TaxID=168379 RepID=A0ABS1E5W1_9GAMM|nr:SCP2 sterol-binding domain-containing protein [Halorhodospira neutriphila]MBK1726209.1 hypothetical protein [Halorhodospira neutriphila]
MLATLLNRLIRLDPEAPRLLAPLAGRRVRLVLDGLPARVVRFTAAGIELSADTEAADAEIEASAEALRALALEGGSAVGRLRIRGEVGVANDLSRLLSGLQPDWEEPLTRALGDPLGHWSATAARRLGRWAAGTAAAGGRGLGRWLTGGSGPLAEPGRVRAHLDEVDRLRADVDRLERRVLELERRRP